MADTTLSEGPPERRTGPGAQPRGGLRRGTTLARYIVIDRLGGGGMGDVYSAWDEELRRRVALKVIRPREGTDARARMLAEARALASLRHPHVVAVHDAGETSSGVDAQPMVYVAMEHLEGVPGTAWLRGDADDAERIRVVLQCAQGLAAAHAQGLVHRDVKPSNVVVETRGSGPWAMLVDFGLAAPQAEAAALSGGTRAYMAPECLEGAAADFRADQWSLALMAAELLSGDRPTHDDAVAGRLGSCGAATAPLQRALARRPAQRFEDVAAFASALRGAVTRRTRRSWAAASLVAVAVGTGAIALATNAPPSCVEQMRGAQAANAPRERIDASLSALRERTPQVAASVATLTETWSDRWGQQHLDACEARASGPRADIERCLRQEAVDIMALLQVGAEDTSVGGRWQILGGLARAVQADVCAAADPAFVETSPALARAVALETASRLDEAFTVAKREADQQTETTAPTARARVLLRLASIQRRRGNLEASQELGEQAMRWAAPADDAHTWARTLHVRIETWIGLGDYDRALEAARLARPIVAAAGDPPDVLAYWHYSEGRALGAASRFAQARNAHTEALEIRQQTGAHTLYVADSHRAIGNISMRMADCEAATPHLHQAVTLYQASLGPGSPNESFALSSLAQCQAQSGELETALATSRRASSQLQATLGPNSVELAKVLTMEGSILGGRGEYAASLVPFRRAAKIREAALGLEHPETLVAHTNLGWLLVSIGEVEQAAAVLMPMVARIDGPDKLEHPNPATFVGAMAALHDAQGHPEQAVEFATRALALAETSPASSNPLTLTTPLYNLGELCEKAGDTEQARKHYTRAWALLDTHPAGQQQPTWAPTNLALGRISQGPAAAAFLDAAVTADAGLAEEAAQIRDGHAPRTTPSAP